VRTRQSLHEQRTPEWLADRAGRVTGSAAAAVFAQGKGKDEAETRRKYRVQVLLEQYTGRPGGSSYVNAAMQWGIDHEAEALYAYECASGEVVTVPGFIFAERVMVGASLDGIIGKEGALEIKCPDSATHVDYLRGEKLPSTYYRQALHNLWVTGRKWLDFVSYDPRFPEDLRLFVVRFMPTRKELVEHALGVRKFLNEVRGNRRELGRMIEKRRAKNG